MTCYRPVIMYRSKSGPNADGKWPLVSSPAKAYGGLDPVPVPCGKCYGCKRDRARVWSMRCQAEASLYDVNSFVTLTYRDECLPENGSLDPKAVTDFFKRLRSDGHSFRYFMCGEYGSLYQRPHYHILFFNWEPEDKKFFKRSGNNIIYQSDYLAKKWKYGYNSIGELTQASCNYVSRYILKKMIGADKVDHYASLGIVPEYTRMSRCPGIGAEWIAKHYQDVYLRSGGCVRIGNNQLSKAGRYFDSIYTLIDPEHFEEIKELRVEYMKHSQVFDFQRLRDIEKCRKVSAISTSHKINYENDFVIKERNED